MGYMRHHAIIITGWDEDRVSEAHKAAVRTGNIVTPVTASNTNGYQSFCIVPDGSKEGWSRSQEGDESRNEFIEWLTEHMREVEDDDGKEYISWWLDWAEVRFGDDDGEASLTRASDKQLTTGGDE